ncbi:hypothetical protein PVAND_010451 [Polypedilum vanderplanki]|uniref:Uncharacterized protein n=1 Tax=Polypedilum vanderplanki TaxID=319348 RepID=A0A9J6CFK4_POLVA|nr:hypothetical protein PVAND_010451 [Polypedilum vanderplanki]
MSDKDTKKQDSTCPSTSSNAQEIIEMPPAIKNVNVFQSLENCEKFIDKESHIARLNALRKEGLEYLQETNWRYNNGT